MENKKKNRPMNIFHQLQIQPLRIIKPWNERTTLSSLQQFQHISLRGRIYEMFHDLPEGIKTYPDDFICDDIVSLSIAHLDHKQQILKWGPICSLYMKVVTH